jgi:hypothetical protein
MGSYQIMTADEYRKNQIKGFVSEQIKHGFINYDQDEYYSAIMAFLIRLIHRHSIPDWWVEKENEWGTGDMYIDVS